MNLFEAATGLTGRPQGLQQWTKQRAPLDYRALTLQRHGIREPVFEELLEKLKNCDHVPYETGPGFIRVLPTGGTAFPVMIEWIWDTHFTVFLDGWHQDFDSYEKAVSCFILAVSGSYRLKTRSKDRFHFRWTVEYWDGSRWVEGSTVSDLFYPYWKPTTTDYLRNDVHCAEAHDSEPSIKRRPIL